MKYPIGLLCGMSESEYLKLIKNIYGLSVFFFFKFYFLSFMYILFSLTI